MTIGTGIFLSVLLLSLLVLYKWTRDRWTWRKINKRNFLWPIYVLLALSGLGFIYSKVDHWFVSAPDSYYGISLGMTRDEVLYKMGNPSLGSGGKFVNYHFPAEVEPLKADIRLRVWFNEEDYSKVSQITCDKYKNNYGVHCSHILGISTRTTEKEIYKILGKPTATSYIHEGTQRFGSDGTRQIAKCIYYDRLKLSLLLFQEVVSRISLVKRDIVQTSDPAPIIRSSFKLVI